MVLPSWSFSSCLAEWSYKMYVPRICLSKPTGHHVSRMAIMCRYQLQFQNTHALNNVWRGPSSFHQSLDISLSGQPREREWAALMIGIREDKLTSDLTILTSPPSQHNTQWTNNTKLNLLWVWCLGDMWVIFYRIYRCSHVIHLS